MLERLLQQLAHDGSRTLTIRVRPGASVSKINGQLDDGAWKIDIAAPPEEGKANAELVRFLAKQLGVPRSHVELVAGGTARRKILRIRS